MKDIINFNAIVKYLERQNLRIDNKTKLKKYIEDNNFNTVIGGYSQIFFKENSKKIYDSEATSSQIIDFYQFDVDFANHVIRLLLRIEKKLNTSVAYTVINAFHIEDRCLFKLNPNFIKQNIFSNLKMVNPPIDFDRIIHLLVKYCETNDNTKVYKIKNTKDVFLTWSELPLDIMCLTWSFATTFSVFLALNDELTEAICEKFNLDRIYTSGFIDFIKNILYLRNLISHNYVLYNARIKYQSEAIKILYFHLFKVNVKHIGLIELLKMIEFFSNDDKLIKNTTLFFNKLKLKEKFKKRVKIFVKGNNNEQENI